jgi:CRP-like cAMP-binding protein
MFDKICAWLKERQIRIVPEDLEIFSAYTRLVVIPPQTIIMHQGKAVNKLFFLNEGIVRLFKIHNDTDFTLGVVSSNDFVSTTFYLLNQQPSTCALETLTEVTALEWDRDAVQALLAQTRMGTEIEKAHTDRLLNWLQELQVDIMCLTGEERYLKLLERQPEVIRTVPLKYIASFLGIHQDSLSRIRNKIGRKEG